VPIIPDKDYRENYQRAIYVTGKITQELVDKLTPEINRLRLTSNDPITAYIDSQGGEIWMAETIRRLSTSVNPDGKCCRLITVVTGTAASAAADLLALGDYAIAYNHADILYHGTRQTTDKALTVEGAATISSSLHQTNEFFALRLARQAFDRFFMRLTQLADEFVAFRDGGDNAPIRPLVKALESNFSRLNSKLLKDSLKRQQVIAELTASITAHLKKFNDVSKFTDSKFEAELMKGIINFKVKAHKNERWLLSGTGLTEVTADFSLLHDFHYGKQRTDLKRLCNIYGEALLSDTQKTHYNAIKGNSEAEKEQAQAAWLRRHTERRLQAIWYFLVSLCRVLQTEDFLFDPEEAYWIGLVDEVPDAGLPNLREMVEAQTASTTNPSI
jgi:hypothetical protein